MTLHLTLSAAVRLSPIIISIFPYIFESIIMHARRYYDIESYENLRGLCHWTFCHLWWQTTRKQFWVWL